MLQIGQLCFITNVRALGQTLGQTLLEIGASIVTNWGSYYKLGQLLLRNRAAITNWGRYYKLEQLLQIGT